MGMDSPGTGLWPKPVTSMEGLPSPTHLQRDTHTGSNVPDDGFGDSSGSVALVAVHFDDRALHKGRHRRPMTGTGDRQWLWKHPSVPKQCCPALTQQLVLPFPW